MTDSTGAAPIAIRAVVTDWAGTIVDFGSLAPMTAVIEVFRRCGIEITAQEARAPMGLAKRDHLAAVMAIERVAASWRASHRQIHTDADINRLYADFLVLQAPVLRSLSRAIPGVAETMSLLRGRGIKIGSTTGYTRDLMDVVTAVARADGVEVDAVVMADDVPAGRPAPWMIFRAAEKLNVYPMTAVAVVDDTAVGIEAARNAGAWAIAVAKTGNLLGLSCEEAMAMSHTVWNSRRSEITRVFERCGAHLVIDSFNQLPAAIGEIERLLAPN